METTLRPTWERSRAWVIVVCLAAVPVLAALTLDSGSTGLLVAAIGSGLVLVCGALVWALHRVRRQRRDFEERLASWAADRAVAQERLRIARDLHDLSSHGLGVITVLATATSFLDGPDADARRQRAMLDIERVGRSTTAELRRMLTLLRTPADDPAPLQPADTLAALPGIIDTAERAGLIIQTTIEGLDSVDGTTDDDLSPSVQLTICAVMREALTNVVRHAGPTTVRLAITHTRGVVHVTVDDDGKQPGWQPEPGAGHGLTGLRERVGTYGGTLAASPSSHGFRLRATIPTGAST
ncbi:MAG: histidine kinase [Microbacterium sp.]|jgi:signal transduction histidine kinase|nr:histidine kinase [Microbacterium sp.]